MCNIANASTPQSPQGYSHPFSKDVTWDFVCSSVAIFAGCEYYDSIVGAFIVSSDSNWSFFEIGPRVWKFLSRVTVNISMDQVCAHILHVVLRPGCFGVVSYYVVHPPLCFPSPACCESYIVALASETTIAAHRPSVDEAWTFNMPAPNLILVCLLANKVLSSRRLKLSDQSSRTTSV